jgi:hypothetical protein
VTAVLPPVAAPPVPVFPPAPVPPVEVPADPPAFEPPVDVPADPPFDPPVPAPPALVVPPVPDPPVPASEPVLLWSLLHAAATKAAQASAPQDEPNRILSVAINFGAIVVFTSMEDGRYGNATG